jgi:hypothetical protein
MTAWRSDLVAAIRLIRAGGSASSRVERLAAAGIGLLVLTGAVVTYVVLPGPATAPNPAGADRPTTTSPGPR